MKGVVVVKHRIAVITVFGAWLATMLAGPAWAELTIGEYELISTTRVSRIDFEYTYRANITNTGADVENVTAQLSSTTPNTIVVDGSLSFGAANAASTVTSTDTFTIRQDRSYPFSWSDMSWDIFFDTPVPEGVLLEGNPGDVAMNALVRLRSAGVDNADILDGAILNRLDLAIERNATIGQVNQALLNVNARITDMQPGLPYIEVAIPRQAAIDAVQLIADQLAASPGIRTAFLAWVPQPTLLPPEHTDFLMLDSVQHLLPARFPAAWNAAGLIEFDEDGNCVHPVTVLVADFWYKTDTTHPESDAYDKAATKQLQLDPLIRPAPDQPNVLIPFLVTDYYVGFHGYDVTSTMAARFDANPPTGAMPLTDCLNLIGVPVNGYSFARIALALWDNFPDTGKFLINASLGFPGDDGRRGDDGSMVTPGESRLVWPLERAELATIWRVLAEDDKDRFLLFSAAGNDADDLFVDIYPGAATAAYSNPFSVAAIPGDPLFDFALDAAAWSGDGVFPDVTAPPADLAALRADLINNDLADELNNVLVVGSTTNQELADDLVESDFSDRGAQIYAVGENIPNLTWTRELEGTSFATPQVAGLAAYLWLIAPELTDEGIPTFITRYLIEHSVNELGKTNTINLIDAYLAALTFDLDPDLIGVPVIQFGEAPVREAILDIDGDELFEEEDLKHYLIAYYNGNFLDPEVPPVLPSIRDYSRFDLNGNGFTGGNSVERFDLDLLASPEVTPVYDEDLLLPITLPSASLVIERSFDENNLTDLDILCYYAFSPLYHGDLIGTRGLGSLTWLSDCVDIETVIDNPSNILLSSTVQFAAHVIDIDQRTLVDTTEALGWEQFRWTSSNPDVAVFDALGRLHVAGMGSTTIGASYGRAATTSVLTVPFEDPFQPPTLVTADMDFDVSLDSCRLPDGENPGGTHLLYFDRVVFEQAVVLETVADIQNVRDPALVWVRATGGIMPTDEVYPAAGDLILQYAVPGFYLSEILETGIDADGCLNIRYRSYGYQAHVANTPWPLWQLPGTSALPYTGAIEQPLWVEIEPPVPAVLGTGDIGLQIMAANAALQIAIDGSGTNSVNIAAVAPWVISRVSAVNPINEQERIVIIVQRDGVACEIDLALAVKGDESDRFLQVEELTGWYCGLGNGSNCPGWFDSNIAGSPPSSFEADQGRPEGVNKAEAKKAKRTQKERNKEALTSSRRPDI